MGKMGPGCCFFVWGEISTKREKVEKVKLGQMFDNVEGLVWINLVGLEVRGRSRLKEVLQNTNRVEVGRRYRSGT